MEPHLSRQTFYFKPKQRPGLFSTLLPWYITLQVYTDIHTL